MCTWAHERGLGMTSLPLSTLRFRHSKPVFRLLCYFLSLFLVKRLLLYRIICFCLIFRFLIHVPLSFCNKKYFIIRLKRLFHHTLKILNGNAERRRLASMDDVNYSKVLYDEFCWNTCEMLKFRICMSLDADTLTCMESIYLKSFFTELAKSQTMPTELVVMHECRIIPYNRHHIRTCFGKEKYTFVNMYFHYGSVCNCNSTCNCTCNCTCMGMYLLFNAYSNCSQNFFRFHHSTKHAKPIVKRPKENIQNHFISSSFNEYLQRYMWDIKSKFIRFVCMLYSQQ